MNCDMCGKEAKLFKTNIEGSELSVCSECSKYGEVISEIKEKEPGKKEKVKYIMPKREILFVIADGYGEIIKKAREKLGFNQENFAKMINEKVSLVHKIETEEFEPSIDMARKFERFLKIRLVEQHEEEHEGVVKGKSEEYTIGDFVKVKGK